MNKNIERLHEIAVEGLKWYGDGANKQRKEFGTLRFLDSTYTREKRIAFINTLIEVYENIAIQEVDGKYTLDAANMEEYERHILIFAYLDLDAKTLRGDTKDMKLKPKDMLYINKWNPLLLYTLSLKHDIPYEKWEMRNNVSQYLLGRDLCDLLVVLNYSELDKINIHGKYYVGKLCKVLRDEHFDPERTHREEYTDDDEDRITFGDPENKIIKRYSPWSYTYVDNYPQYYDSIPALYKLTEDFMYNLVNEGIINKPEILRSPTPEGSDF